MIGLFTIIKFSDKPYAFVVTLILVDFTRAKAVIDEVKFLQMKKENTDQNSRMCFPLV